MATLAAILVLALSRAELIERFKAPIVTQADGFIRVYADCPEDMRREYQSPIASFAAETVKTLCRGLSMNMERSRRPGVAIYVGDVRTNDVAVVAKAVTNDSQVLTLVYVRAPGYADLERLRIEVVKGFFRRVKGVELSDGEAVAAWRAGDPALRIEDERGRLEEWLATGRGVTNDEEGLKLMRKIIQPGFASPRDVLTFASRLYLYPPQYDLRLGGRRRCVSFGEAIAMSRADPMVRLLAFEKAKELPVFGGGHGEAMNAAAAAYGRFLLELARGEKGERALRDLLDDADTLLNVAYEKSTVRQAP